MNKHNHIASENYERFILRQTGENCYFPLTEYRCSICGEFFYTDGIGWAIQGIPSNVQFEPFPPEGDEFFLDVGFGTFKVRK